MPGARGALIATLAAALMAAAPAAAAPVTYDGPAGSVTVERAPFRLVVKDRDGRTVLASLGRDRTLGGVRYAGLSFSAGGAEPELAAPLLAGETAAPAGPAPRRYVARRVTAVRRAGRELVVTLSTDDPSGRRIRLRVGPGPAGTLRLEATVRGAAAVSAAFASSRSEAFHGFGGRRESTDLRGRSFVNWVLDYRYPDATTGYYTPLPSFVSSRGYGLLVDGERIGRWRLASDSPRAWRYASGGSSLALVVAPGGPVRAMRTLSAITGRHRLPPAWSIGATLSRTIGIVGDSGGRYRQRVEDDVARLERRKGPVAVYAFEGWATLPRPFVREVARRLRARGIRTLLYMRSFVSDDAAGTEAPGAFDEAVGRGLVARTAGGGPFFFPSPFTSQSNAAVLDFTNPATRRWWHRRVAALLDTGASGFMSDFGEQVLPGMRFRDGSTGAKMHNRFPVLQARTTRQAIGAWQRRHPGRTVYFFSRAAYAGAPGSAAWENAQFPGDNTVDWSPSTGIASVVPDMLNRAIGGAPGFTIDIGGYAQFTTANPFLDPTPRELFIRWTQLAALTPFFRVHNSGLSGVRMPWSYDPATLRHWEAMARLHARARPLILRLWRRFLRTGVPVTRPLWLADPGAGRGPRGDDQWLLGPDLLVAPVITEGATSRPVRLPPGCWRREGGGTQLRGDRTITVKAPLLALPWFTRCGSRPLG